VQTQQSGTAGLPWSAALDGRPAALDGEIVFYNEASQIDFGLL
jgi:hypothetical protein